MLFRILGLSLPPVPAPVAAYVPAVRTGNHVYTSGQLPLVDGKLLGTAGVTRPAARSASRAASFSPNQSS